MVFEFYQRKRGRIMVNSKIVLEKIPKISLFLSIFTYLFGINFASLFVQPYNQSWNSTNIQNITSVNQAIAFTFRIPYFAYALILIIFGISLYASKKVYIAVGLSMISSLVLSFVFPYLTSLDILLFTVTLITFAIEYFKQKE